MGEYYVESGAVEGEMSPEVSIVKAHGEQIKELLRAYEQQLMPDEIQTLREFVVRCGTIVYEIQAIPDIEAYNQSLITINTILHRFSYQLVSIQKVASPASMLQIETGPGYSPFDPS